MFCKDTSCMEVLKKKITYLASKKCFNIIGLGGNIIDNLVTNNVIKKISDLFKLNKRQILELEGFGEKLTANLLNQIDKRKKITMSKFISSLGIRHVGENISNLLSINFNSIHSLSLASIDQIEAIDGIGIEIANSVKDFFDDKKNIQEIDTIFQNGVEIQNEQSFSGDLMLGKSVCITGKFKNYSRDELQSIVLSQQGKVVSSISKNTNILIVGESPGSKLKKAKELGIKVIDEDEFLKLKQ